MILTIKEVVEGQASEGEVELAWYRRESQYFSGWVAAGYIKQR